MTTFYLQIYLQNWVKHHFLPPDLPQKWSKHHFLPPDLLKSDQNTTFLPPDLPQKVIKTPHFTSRFTSKSGQKHHFLPPDLPPEQPDLLQIYLQNSLIYLQNVVNVVLPPTFVGGAGPHIPGRHHGTVR